MTFSPRRDRRTSRGRDWRREAAETGNLCAPDEPRPGCLRQLDNRASVGPLMGGKGIRENPSPTQSLVGRQGFEPWTYGLKIRSSAD